MSDAALELPAVGVPAQRAVPGHAVGQWSTEVFDVCAEPVRAPPPPALLVGPEVASRASIKPPCFAQLYAVYRISHGGLPSLANLICPEPLLHAAGITSLRAGIIEPHPVCTKLWSGPTHWILAGGRLPLHRPGLLHAMHIRKNSSKSSAGLSVPGWLQLRGVHSPPTRRHV